MGVHGTRKKAGQGGNGGQQELEKLWSFMSQPKTEEGEEKYGGAESGAGEETLLKKLVGKAHDDLIKVGFAKKGTRWRGRKRVETLKRREIRLTERGSVRHACPSMLRGGYFIWGRRNIRAGKLR